MSDPVADPDHRPAPCSLPRRLAALIYDLIVVAAIWMAGAAIVVIPLGESVAAGNAWFRIYLLALAFGYLHLSWRHAGQTLGMRAWRIRIVAENGRLGLRHSLIRCAVATVSTIMLGAGFLWSLLRRDRAAWHDLASRSRLVRVTGGK